ncbi:MAG: GDSL-type esterase/lipase family protein, partial [Lachnospiraceae bacterium]|nr:GDSL-type esterase/lipase family protein [Lachnospiraceae bacterium]
VILMLGSNDMKKVFKQNEEMIGKHIRELILTIKRVSADKDPKGKECNILLVSPIHISEAAVTGPFREEFDAGSVKLSQKLAPVYRQIAKEEKIYYLDASKCAAPGELDGLHLNQAGHKSLSEAMAVKVWEILGEN